MIRPLSALISIARGQKKSSPDEEAIGRSRGGLSTKIHATVDALGNPTSFLLTPGQAHDLAGADQLLPEIGAETVIADKGYDAQERVIGILEKSGKKAIIPSKSNVKEPRIRILMSRIKTFTEPVI